MRWPLAIALLLTLPTASPAEAQVQAVRFRPWKTPTPKQLRRCEGSRAYTVRIDGKACGRVREQFRFLPGRTGGRFSHTTRATATLTSDGTRHTFQRTERLEFDGTPPYRLRVAELIAESGKDRRWWRAQRLALGWQLRIVEAGEVRDVPRFYPTWDYTAPDAVSLQLWLRGERSPGDVLTRRNFSIENLGTYLDRFVLERTVSTPAGRRHLVAQEDLLKKKREQRRYDATGWLLRSVDGRYVTEHDPKGTAPTSASPDLFRTDQLRLVGKLGDPRRRTRLKLVITGPNHGRFRPGPRQRVELLPDRTVVEIDRRLGPRSLIERSSAEAYLAPTLAIPSDHADVKALARKATAGAKTQAERVRRLVRFVHRYLLYCHDNTQSVLQVIKNRRGDCTEHALLFTALARAAGVPAREVSGLVYMGDHHQAFGRHAWNEVVLEGEWIPVDATWDEDRINATHIRLHSADEDHVDHVGLGKLQARLVLERPAPRTRRMRTGAGSALQAPGD